MSLPPLRSQNGRGEGESPPLPDQESPNELFRALAARVIRASPEDVREAHRQFTKDQKTKRTKSRPGLLIPNPKNAT
jgi:hypothetical protein